MVRASLYIRVSTDDQTEYSPSAQKKALVDYATRNNMLVSDELIFSDEGFSGRTVEKRPAFMKMIGLAKSKEKLFDIILVHKFDRFARNRETSVTYKQMLIKDCGIKVISITESIEDDKMSILIEALLEAMAEYYSINLSEEVKKGMTEKAIRGGFQTSPPLGYEMSKSGKLVIVPEEAKYIQYIFDQYVNHKKGCFPIARSLNQMGVKTKRGGRFDNRGVSYILQNPIYKGMVRWTPTMKVRRNFEHPETIISTAEHEAIVSDELFEKARLQLKNAKQKAKYKARPLIECKHWLSGLVKCSNCGSSLILASTIKYPSFQCHSYSKGMCEVSHSITAKKLENAILERLGELLKDIDTIDFHVSIKRTDDNQMQIESLKKQLHTIENKKQRANQAYLSEVYSLLEYTPIKFQLDKDSDEIIQEINRLQNSQTEVISEIFKNRFITVVELLSSQCEISKKQEAARSIIEKIIYDKANNNLELFLYDN